MVSALLLSAVISLAAAPFVFTFVSSVFSVVNFFSVFNEQQWAMNRLKQVVFSTAAIARGMPKKCGTTEDTENTE